MKIEKRLQELGIELPPIPAPAGNYVQYMRTGNLIFLSGAGPHTGDGHIPTGKVVDPPAEENLHTYPVKVEGDEIYVGVEKG